MRNRHLLLPTLALALGLGLTTAACGSDSSGDDDVAAAGSDTTGSEGEAASGPGDAALAYAECMREEGVEDYPDPEISEDGGVRIGGPGLDDPDLAAAEEACGDLLDDGGSFEAADPEREAELEAQVLAYAECMREQGIDYPDPEVDGGRVQMRVGEGVDTESPEFIAAQETCEDEMPSGMGGQP